jgi:tRNA A-37 threonylcarbamoyl transferase component Bud32
MASAKTECTELSVGFGILGIENILDLTQNQVENYFEGTLSTEKYDRFKNEYPNRKTLCKQMYNVGFGLRAIHTPFKDVNSLKWAGPQQQSAMTAVAKDLLVANTAVSIKGNSNVVLNSSPYNLFETIPRGQVKAQSSENWFLEQASQEYQELYSFVQSRNLEYFPEDVREFELSTKRKERQPLKEVLKHLSEDEQQAFDQLYLRMCHKVAKVSADIFNNNYTASMQGRMRNAILEQITRHFFRMNSVDYILGGIDKKKGFAVVVPEITRWKQNWSITNIIAEPELDKRQSRVRFTVFYKNRKSKKMHTAEFHAQIRWSHGKFQSNPEAKLYKNFAWEDVFFFESIYGHGSIKRLRIIGSGSYGIVYEALHRITTEKVAVKEFRANIATTKEERGRFEREVKLMSKFRHPNILPVLDYDLSGKNNPWFAMPLAKTNIAEIIDELKHDLQRVNFFYYQILTGMAYAHKQNTIHRDLKPQNILVFENDLAMIGDFGLGKILGEDASVMILTDTDDQFGTFAYMAPEQFTSAANVDHRADIYSLGKTLLHMVVGGDPPMFPDQIIHQVDIRYLPFIKKCIEELPEDRFQSVDEMLESFVTIMDIGVES